MLSFSPCCADAECWDETVTEHTEHNHSEKTCNSCSHFMSCDSCACFIVFSAHHDLRLEIVVIDKQKMRFVQEYFDGFYTEFWQPPKLSY